MRQKTPEVPTSIRVIAGLYYLPLLALLWSFIQTRIAVSVWPVAADALTIPLLFAPVLSLWGLYRPTHVTRWFPFLSIALVWVIALIELWGLRLGPSIIQGDDVTDLVVGGWAIFMGLVLLTIALVLPALLLLAIPSARRYLFAANPTIDDRQA